MSKLLEADSIRKEFGTNQVLTDIYIRCETGDIIGLLGRNGSGKSTLLKIIFGTLDTEHKFIRINNKILKQPYRAKKTIAYLCQDNFLPGNLTIREVLKVYAEEVDDNNFLEDSILDIVKDTKIRNLSGGESRYLEVKLILSLKRDFILLDEPFNGISPLHIDRIKNMIVEKSAGKGIILTDHDYRNVLDVAKTYYLLFDGGLRSVKNKQDLITWGYVPEEKYSEI
jgi:lipopolysaccharide export system ATP-binding protein